ncbi:hypothetical protein HG531_010904 [Fusarium graminearum]|nr:hypothetical protein HG531_010904 [Fusarium graminearum]
MYLKTAGSQQSIIDHVLSLGEKLVHHAVTNTSTSTRSGATLLTDSVKFVKDDNMQTTLISLLLVLFFCVGEQLSDVLLRLTNILVENLRSVDDFGWVGVQHFTNLSGNQRFSGTWRAVQQQSLDVSNTHLGDQARRENTRCKCTTENGSELIIQTTDTHILELEVRSENGVGVGLVHRRLEVEVTLCITMEDNLTLSRQDTPSMGFSLGLLGGVV